MQRSELTLQLRKEETNQFFHFVFVFSGRSRHYEAKSDWHFKMRERRANSSRENKLPFGDSENLVDVLQQTAAYRATNPLDKIFALEGLVDPIMAQLLDISYKRPLSEVYRKVTVQAVISSSDFGSLVRIFDFLRDSRKTIEARQLWPSWIIDFTYSDAAQRKVQDETNMYPTFEGCIYSAAHAIQHGWADREGDTFLPDGIFFSSKTLHCFGSCIPTTCGTFSIKLMPLSTGWDDPLWHGFRNVFRDDFAASRNPYLAAPYIGGDKDFDQSWSRRVKPAIRPQMPSISKSQSEGPDAPDELAEKWMLGLRELWSLGYDREKGAVWALSDPNLPPIVPLSERCWACVGKYAMFLESGLVALSRVAHSEGDLLALLGGTGVFLHLRPVEREGEDPQYRIVSRALVAGTLQGNVQAVLEEESAYDRYFEIV